MEMLETKFVSSKVGLGEAKKMSLSLDLPMGYGLTCTPIIKKILFTVYSVGIQNVITYVSQTVSFRLHLGGAGAEKKGSCIIWSTPTIS